MKRKYTRIKIYEEQIIEMREADKTGQEIANKLGLRKEQIKEWVKRYNRRIAETGIKVAKERGRKSAVTLSEYKYENQRLKMENELLRDFLRLCGRG